MTDKNEANEAKKIKLLYLVGDVHFGGHDVQRVAVNNRVLLEAAGAFDITVVCDEPDVGDMDFDACFAQGEFERADVIVFNCGNYRFNIPSEQRILEAAVKRGAGFVFLHGDHPCYWEAVGMPSWKEIERLAGLLWREVTSHGDYADARVTIDRSLSHPITEGLSDFDTRDEIFCGCENVRNVPLTALAYAYSDKSVLSRHGASGTGRMEPVVAVGSYGAGRTVNLLLGHVWPFYTGHGFGENTMLSYAPRQVRQMFVRSCEWAARGNCDITVSFDGEAMLN